MSRFLEKAIERLEKLPDIHVRQILNNLASEQELLEASLNSIPMGLAVTSPEHTLLFLNKRIERLLPWANTDLDQECIWEKIQDREMSSFLREHLLKETNVIQQEFVHGQDSQVLVLQLSILPLVKKGQIKGNVLLLEDVTEKKSRELKLRRAESLASLTTLAAGVAHEIKNPLGSIGIHIQLIQKAIRQAGVIRPQTILKYLDVVNEELDRLNRIVVDFLFAVRPMDIQLSPASLHRLVLDLVQFMRFELEKARIVLKLELCKEDDTILMDERFLKQALLNILKNSIQAMPDGGTIKISTLRFDDELRLMVSDTGIGIPQENIEKIFEPYFTTKEDGTGLGLTMVYKIIKEHGADIEVVSREGQGTTFLIRFAPAKPPARRLIGDGANE